MNLWIRSQDGDLLEKAIMLKIAHLHNESVKEEDFTYSIIVNNDYVFADYKTKERAMEVLDEIENALLNKWADNVKYELCYDDERPRNLVYQMPKE